MPRSSVIVIDPYLRSVMEVESGLDEGSIRDLVGCERLRKVYEFENGDELLIDWGALAKAESALGGQDDGERAYAFDVGAASPFFGKGVIVGPEDGHGEHTAVLMDASRLSGIIFMTPKFHGPDPVGHARH